MAGCRLFLPRVTVPRQGSQGREEARQAAISPNEAHADVLAVRQDHGLP